MSLVCRSCDAPILWITIKPSGKEMPVDAEPTADGNIVIEGEEGFVLTKEHKPFYHGPLYISHFATCPFASAYRNN